MIYLQLDYLDEKRDYTGTTIHFYYEKAQDWGKRNLVEYAHYYSFFPYTLEYAAITQNKDYYKKANLPHCEPHMTKVTCFSAALSGKTLYRRIRL